MCVSVRGALKWPKKDLKGLFIVDGIKTTSEESFNILLDRLAEGWEVLPLGEMCEGFDKKNGCPGHEE